MLLIENRYLPVLVPFLEGMKLAGAQSRARSKLLNMAVAAYKALGESELELVKEYAVCDNTGQPVLAEDGSFELKNPEQSAAYFTAREQLLAEASELNGATYKEHLPQLQSLLADYQEVLSGDEAAVYDHLCDMVDQALKDKGAQ